jgi:hexokinase
MRIETVTYRINWQKLKVGYSFFVPCIDTRAAKEEVQRVTKRLKVATVMKVVVEDGVKGLRVWRV